MQHIINRKSISLLSDLTVFLISSKVISSSIFTLTASKINFVNDSAKSSQLYFISLEFYLFSIFYFFLVFNV